MIRFRKLSNGNVLIEGTGNEVLMSLSPSMNVFTHPTIDNGIFITDEVSVSQSMEGTTITFADVDQSGCVPVILASDVSELIEALATDFFFRSTVIFKGSFAYNQDKMIAIGKDFSLSYEGSTQQLKVRNHATGWFSAFIELTKSSTRYQGAYRVASGQASYYISSNGTKNTNFGLTTAHASHLSFKITKTDAYNKEIYKGELMRAGNVINAIIYKN